MYKLTVFENHRKSLIQNCERSELRFLFEWTKFIKKVKNGQFGEFLKIWSLRSNSVTRQVNFNWTKIGENAKIETLKCDILDDFQTLWKVCVY